MNNGLLGRSIKMEAAQRCDACGLQIPKGKHATQVIGDPEAVKAQGLYHGRLCYQMALADYEEKLKEMKVREGEDE